MQTLNDNWFIRHIKNTALVDEIDANMIKELLEDSRQTTQALADKVGIKRPTAHERLKKIKERGLIDSYSASINYAKCGLPLRAFILIGFDANKNNDMTQKEVAKMLSREDYVVEVDIITGSHDFLVQLAVDYMNTLSDVIIEKMRKIPGVGATQTLLSFRQYQEGYEINKQN